MLIADLTDARKKQRKGQPSPPLPFFGFVELRNFLRDPLSNFFRHEAELGPVYRLEFVGQEMVVMLGPDANELALLNKDQHFVNAPTWNEQIGRYFRGGLLLRDGDEHRAHRLMLNAAFTDVAIRSYVEDMQEVIADRISRWPREAAPLLAFRELKQMTLEVAAKVFLGERPSARTEVLNRAFLDIVQASGPGNVNKLAIPGTLTYRGVRGRALLEQYLEARIEAKRCSSERDLFALLCRGETRGKARLTRMEIVDHLIFLLMAAHDTSTLTATKIFYMLGRHPEWQERCREEVRVFGKGPIAIDDLDRVPILDYVMKEALRLLPPLPFTSRTAVEDLEYAGVPVYAGQNVTIAPLHTHRLPSLWSEPDTFDPMRFAPERAEHKRHRFGYVPFGGGVHKCLGMRFAELEVRTILAYALRTHRWSVPEGYAMPLDFTSLPIPSDGLPITIEAL